MPTLPAYVFERASLPTTPIPTGSLRSALVGLLLGLVSSVGIILLIDSLDVTIRDHEDAELELDLRVLGAIPLHDSELPSASGNHLRDRRAGR